MKDRIKEILEAEARAILGIKLDDSVERAVEHIAGCKGKLFTCGIGKAGYVARKAASTFSTTGTPAVFLHPADAPHGDVGVVSRGDILLVFSNSGQTREVIETIHHARALHVGEVIGITGNANSPLGALCDVTLDIGKIEEPCPLRMTPTASTAAMIALTDALALVAMERKGFTKEDFAIRHHGGYLGKKSRDEV
jgi:arabinose-5-phosphate isomerase